MEACNSPINSESPIARLIREKAKIFHSAYLDVSQEIFERPDGGGLYHPGEFGQYRESLVKSLMSSFLPGGIEFGSGFIVDSNNCRSSQVDLIAYDVNENPKIEDSSMRRFFPVETTVGIGEVKSKVKFSELKDYLNKLEAVKRLCMKPPRTLIPSRPSWRTHEIVAAQLDLRDSLGARPSPRELSEALASTFNPAEHNWQAKFSFLVCSEFSFGNGDIPDKLKEIVGAPPVGEGDEAFAARHNALLSVKDGYQSYYSEGLHSPYPRAYNHKLEMHAATGMSFIPADENCTHIIAFASDLASALADTASYPFIASDYFSIKRSEHPW